MVQAEVRADVSAARTSQVARKNESAVRLRSDQPCNSICHGATAML